MVNPKNIPDALHHFIPLAIRFGIVDDLQRESTVRAATASELQELRELVSLHDASLDSWLAGSESSGPYFSDEYIMFSAMRMAADYAAA